MLILVLLSILGVLAILAAFVWSLRSRSAKPKDVPTESADPVRNWGSDSRLPNDAFTF